MRGTTERTKNFYTSIGVTAALFLYRFRIKRNTALLLKAIEHCTHIVTSGCKSMSVPCDGGNGDVSFQQNVLELSYDEIKSMLKSIVERCRKKGEDPPRMLVANPDFVTVNGRDLEIMPGTIAKWYKEEILKENKLEDVDSYVELFGKPAGVIYESLARKIQLGSKEMETSFSFEKNVICVGDSSEHDIKGAQLSKAKSVFIVETGIHAEEFQVDKDVPRLISKYKGIQMPTYSIAKFSF